MAIFHKSSREQLADRLDAEACRLAIMLDKDRAISSDSPSPSRLRTRAAELATLAQALRRTRR
jgi:hypothetical protein